MAVALVGAGEAVANRLSTGDIDVDEAAELMIDLFWYGLKGSPAEREAAAAQPEAGGPDAAATRPTFVQVARERPQLGPRQPRLLLRGNHRRVARRVAGLATTFVLRSVQHAHLPLHVSARCWPGSPAAARSAARGPDGRRRAGRAGWWMLRRRATCRRSSRPLPSTPDTAAVVEHRRPAAGVAGWLWRLAGPGRSPTPICSRAERFGHRMAQAALARRPRDPAGLRGRGRPGAEYATEPVGSAGYDVLLPRHH